MHIVAQNIITYSPREYSATVLAYISEAPNIFVQGEMLIIKPSQY
jgi:hypothetical protein